MGTPVPDSDRRNLARYHLGFLTEDNLGRLVPAAAGLAKVLLVVITYKAIAGATLLNHRCTHQAPSQNISTAQEQCNGLARQLSEARATNRSFAQPSCSSFCGTGHRLANLGGSFLGSLFIGGKGGSKSLTLGHHLSQLV